MRFSGKWAGRLVLASTVLAAPGQSDTLFAQAPINSVTAADPAASTPGQVVINREAIQLTAPDAYKIPLQLEPVQVIDIASVTDGLVDALRVKVGDRVSDQQEVAQLDRSEQQLQVDRAKANLKAAQLELNQAKAKGDKDLTELAQARSDVAKAEFDLATLRYERGSLRAPFGGTVFRLPVVTRQYVRAGQTLMTIGDSSRLKVEIPVDRTKVKAGDTIPIRVEQGTVQAKVDAVLPLGDRFAPLRELLTTVASAVVTVDNPQGAYVVGQTVYSPLIPQHAVAQLPNSALANGPDGTRKVQVVRENVVRDIPVETLGQVGSDRVYVSGPFAENDEVIVSLSQPLPDGTLIRPASGAAPAAGGRAPAIPARPRGSAF